MSQTTRATVPAVPSAAPSSQLKLPPRALSVGLAILLAGLVILPLLGHKSLTDWDEGIYAEISREMLSFGWLVPHWNFQVWLEKPPLMLWLTAILFRIFGVSDFWARAGSAFSGIAVVGISQAWLLRRSGRLAAWLSSVLLLSSFGFLHVVRSGEMDVLLSLGCVVSLVGFSQVEEGSAEGWRFAWAGLVIALMTKGAASIVLPVTAVIAAVMGGWRTRQLGRPFWLGFGLFLVLTVPWHLAMWHRFHGAFVEEYLGLHVWSRATHQIEGHSTPWWYYVKVLLVSAPPFALLYPVAVWKSLRKPLFRVWGVFAVVEFVFYTLVQTRLPHYIAPIYPVLSVLTAVLLADWIGQARAQPRPTSFWWKLGIATTAIWGISIAVTAAPRRGLHSGTTPGGAPLPGNKDATIVLRRQFDQMRSISGPLLVWRSEKAPIVTDIYYSQRPVVQVSVTTAGAAGPFERYGFHPEPIEENVGSQPRVLLIDVDLLPKMPADLAYQELDRSGAVGLGVVSRRR